MPDYDNFCAKLNEKIEKIEHQARRIKPIAMPWIQEGV